MRRPDLMPRVSDYVPQIIEYIAQIETNGLAYESGGSVYFDTTAFECASINPPILGIPPQLLSTNHSLCCVGLQQWVAVSEPVWPVWWHRQPKSIMAPVLKPGHANEFYGV